MAPSTTPIYRAFSQSFGGFTILSSRQKSIAHWRCFFYCLYPATSAKRAPDQCRTALFTLPLRLNGKIVVELVNSRRRHIIYILYYMSLFHYQYPRAYVGDML